MRGYLPFVVLYTYLHLILLFSASYHTLSPIESAAFGDFNRQMEQLWPYGFCLVYSHSCFYQEKCSSMLSVFQKFVKFLGLLVTPHTHVPVDYFHACISLDSLGKMLVLSLDLWPVSYLNYLAHQFEKQKLK